jgi:hypothetical protein
MMREKKSLFSILAIALTLLFAIAASLTYLASASDDADRASSDAAATRDLAQQILSRRPAGLRTNSSGQLASQLPRILDSAMKVAEIEPENLDRITPQPSRNVSPGGMLEIPTQLVFHQISLRQFVFFISDLGHENDRLIVSDLRLTQPDGVAPSAVNNMWNAEVTVFYLTDSPPAADTASVN